MENIQQVKVFHAHYIKSIGMWLGSAFSYATNIKIQTKLNYRNERQCWKNINK